MECGLKSETLAMTRGTGSGAYTACRASPQICAPMSQLQIDWGRWLQWANLQEALPSDAGFAGGDFSLCRARQFTGPSDKDRRSVPREGTASAFRMSRA